MSFYKQQLRDYLKKVDIRGGHVLSIGAEHDDREYFKSCEVERWKTMDISQQFNPDILFNMNVQVMEDDGDLKIEYENLEAYDFVFAFELWEYIYDPLTAHKNIYQLLANGGTYMGSYPFVYGKHNPAGQDYLRYTDDGIRKLLTLAKFRDIEIIPRISETSLTAFYVNEGMRIRKEVDHDIVGYIVKARK